MRSELEMIQGNCCCMFNNKMLYITEKNSTFVQVNLSNGEVEVLDRDALKSRVSYITIIDDTIFAVDASGAWIAETKIEDKSIVYHDLQCYEKRFAGICLYEKKIFFFFRDETEVMIFDSSSKEIEKHMLDIPYNCERDIFEASCFGGDHVLLFNSEMKIYARYSLKDNIIESVKSLPSIGKISCATYVNGKLYILSGNTVYEMTETAKSIVSVNDKALFTKLCITKNHIWMLPGLGEDILIYSMEDGQYTRYNDYPEDYEYSVPKGWWKFIGSCGDAQYIYWVMRSNNYILRIDRESGQGSWINPLIKNPSLAVKQYLDKRQLVSEGICSLEQYLTYIGLEKE